MKMDNTDNTTTWYPVLFGFEGEHLLHKILHTPLDPFLGVSPKESNMCWNCFCSLRLWWMQLRHVTWVIKNREQAGSQYLLHSFDQLPALPAQVLRELHRARLGVLLLRAPSPSATSDPHRSG